MRSERERGAGRVMGTAALGGGAMVSAWTGGGHGAARRSSQAPAGLPQRTNATHVAAAVPAAPAVIMRRLPIASSPLRNPRCAVGICEHGLKLAEVGEL